MHGLSKRYQLNFYCVFLNVFLSFNQIASQTGGTQKVVTGTVPGITAIQMVKPGTVVAGTSTGAGGTTAKAVSRPVTESEMSALLRRQPQQLQKVSGQLAQVKF